MILSFRAQLLSDFLGDFLGDFLENFEEKKQQKKQQQKIKIKINRDNYEKIASATNLLLNKNFGNNKKPKNQTYYEDVKYPLEAQVVRFHDQETLKKCKRVTFLATVAIRKYSEFFKINDTNRAMPVSKKLAKREIEFERCTLTNLINKEVKVKAKLSKWRFTGDDGELQGATLNILSIKQSF